MKEGWKRIGMVGVDSGQLLITDPCYIDSEWQNEEGDCFKAKHNFSYNACCVKTLADYSGQLNFKMGHEGVGVVFCSGFGDGSYNVYGYFKNYGTAKQPDWRIAQVRIDLITEKELNLGRKIGLLK